MKAANWLRVPGVSSGLAAALENYAIQSGGRLFSLAQLLAMKDFPASLYDGGGDSPKLTDFATLGSGGKIYVNHASALSLSAALNIDRGKAATIERATKDKRYFLDLNDFIAASGISSDDASKLVGLSCGAYRIRALAVVHGVPWRLEAVFVFDESQKLKLVYLGA
jgi:hypothetical protein